MNKWSENKLQIRNYKHYKKRRLSKLQNQSEKTNTMIDDRAGTCKGLQIRIVLEIKKEEI